MSETQGAEGTVVTPPAEGTPGDWRATLPEDIRGAPSMAKFADPAALAKGYLEAEKLIGAKGVILPPENATPEQMKAFHAALGVPEAPEGYELKAPDGLPEGVWSDEAAKGFAAKAHELGLTPAQARGLAEWQAKNVGESMARSGLEPDGRTWEQALQTEWGASYDANMEIARRAAKEFGDEAALAKLGDRIGDSALVRMFHKIGVKVGEDVAVGLGGGAVPTQAQSAKAQIDAIMGDTKGPYWNPMHPEHRATVQQVTRLHELLPT